MIVGSSIGFLLEMIVVRNVLHYIFNVALKNIAEFINGVSFYILIMAQAVNLCTVHIMMGIQIVLCDPTIFHSLPQSVIFDHNAHSFLRG